MTDATEKAPITKTPLLNRSAVKKLALERAKCRAHKFTRVSNDFLVDMESRLRGMIISHVENLPSKGMTI